MAKPKLRISSSSDPGVSGAINDAVHAIKHILGKPQRVYGPQGQTEDEVMGDSTTPSTAGRQAQSTDSFNGY